LALLVSYLPGSVSQTALMSTALIVALAPLVPRGEQEQLRRGSAVSWMLVGVLALALVLRLVNVGYKELQGDEGVIMVRAAAILTGDESELFLHQKGPVEILLPLAAWGLAGVTDDLWARAPFVWAGLLGVAAVFVLGHRWFGRSAGFWAALLFAICGFGIAFSRIIQYQTLVMLWGMLSLLAAVRYRKDGRPFDLELSAVFLAGGLLAHYDAVLAAPAVGWLLVGRLRKEGRLVWRHWGTAVLLGGGILALFYLPFVLNPNFERTFSYLLQGRVGTDESGLPFSWSGAAVWQMITFYNSLWYILGLLVLVGIGLRWLVLVRRHLAAALFFLVPALFYTFIVGDPRTHVYTLFPGAALLAGVGLTWVVERLPSGSGLGRRQAAGLLIGCWLLVSTLYVYLLFVDVSPERQRNWAESRPISMLYPTTWDEPPLYGLFGFPHQAGWRLGAALLADDGLPYASNEEEEITNFYMRQAPRTHCQDFESFVLVSNAQDAIPYDPALLEALFLQRQVMVEGETAMRVFGRTEPGEVVVETAENLSNWVTPEQIRPPVFRGDVPVEVNLDEQALLAGYDVSGTAVSAGERLVVVLYWEALAPFEANKQVFVHLFDEAAGEVPVQDDGAPECAVNPTTRWEPGQIIADPHVIAITAETPPGTYQLVVGMYDLLSKERLVRVDGGGDSVFLTEVMVR
jgi:hypothetical protein